MDDVALATVISAFFAMVASIASALIAVSQGRKVNETHKQVTVNHHSSTEPTVLDRIDDVKTLVLAQGSQLNGLGRDFNQHVSESIQNRERVTKVEDQQNA